MCQPIFIHLHLHFHTSSDTLAGAMTEIMLSLMILMIRVVDLNFLHSHLAFAEFCQPANVIIPIQWHCQLS